MSEFRDNVSSPVMRNIATGECFSLHELPVGALYALDPDDGSFPPWAVGYDGLSVVCVAPGRRYWYVDGRASNCTLPDDKEHKCWVRHGSVGERVHVDKDGKTCAAGAGSLALPDWHGYLHDHQLRETP